MHAFALKQSMGCGEEIVRHMKNKILFGMNHQFKLSNRYIGVHCFSSYYISEIFLNQNEKSKKERKPKITCL